MNSGNHEGQVYEEEISGHKTVKSTIIISLKCIEVQQYNVPFLVHHLKLPNSSDTF